LQHWFAGTCDFRSIDDRPTSLSLEPEFWQYLREIACTRGVTQGRLLSVINQHKGKDIRLASALRLFVAQHYRGEQTCEVAVAPRVPVYSPSQCG
jgi:predicted DNA-binding ribbon-helix-helix protein